MKQRGPSITPPILALVALGLWAYLREDPQCDQGCKNRLDHLLLHVLPLLFKKNLGPTDLIGLTELALPTASEGIETLGLVELTLPTDMSDGVPLGEAPYYPWIAGR